MHTDFGQRDCAASDLQARLKAAAMIGDTARVEADDNDPDGQALLLWYPPRRRDRIRAGRDQDRVRREIGAGSEQRSADQILTKTSPTEVRQTRPPAVDRTGHPCGPNEAMGANLVGCPSGLLAGLMIAILAAATRRG